MELVTAYLGGQLTVARMAANTTTTTMNTGMSTAITITLIAIARTGDERVRRIGKPTECIPTGLCGDPTILDSMESPGHSLAAGLDDHHYPGQHFPTKRFLASLESAEPRHTAAKP